MAGDRQEACAAVDPLASLPAGEKILVEELLDGEEVSVSNLLGHVHFAVEYIEQLLKKKNVTRLWHFAMGVELC